jgi:[acyl-carrier-protein] S-malonyltransferase
MKLAMVFPGQGSQAVGMLKGYDGLPEIDAVRAEARAALGEDFMRIVDEGPAESLNQTVNTQPAMLTAGYAAYRAWCALRGPRPQMLAGHSLGEYTALLAAGAIAFGEALPLVRFRAEAMQQAVPEGRGGMAAILGLEDESVRKACVEAGGEVQAVNFNSPGQVVIAGEKEAVDRAIERCKVHGAKRAMPLPVSAPFHSTLMRPAGQKLKIYLEKVQVAKPAMSVINNVDVKAESEPAAIKAALVRQAASPVRWVETISAMAGAGATHIVECGPGKVLGAFTKRIAPEVQCFSLADRTSLEQALEAMR